MNIFISYPRELKEKARTIATEIDGSGDTVFIDENSIDYTDAWKRKINTGLRKSHLFIILYNLDKESSNDPKRFIKTEIKLIERVLRNKSRKKAIIVLFPPAKTDTIPAFFRKFNAINYNESDIADYEWTTEVLHSIEKLKATERIIKWAGIFIVSLISAAALFSLYKNSNVNDFFDHFFQEETKVSSATSPNNGVVTNNDGKSLCEKIEFLSTFTFPKNYQYLYIDGLIEDGVKFQSYSINGSWQDVKCITQNGNQDKYKIEGLEETTHSVSFYNEQGDLEPLGISTNKHISRIFINQDGSPLDRGFDSYIEKPTFQCTNSKIKQETCKNLGEKYVTLIKKKHDTSKQDACKPLIAKGQGDVIYILSDCKSYIRVLKSLE